MCDCRQISLTAFDVGSLVVPSLSQSAPVRFSRVRVLNLESHFLLEAPRCLFQEPPWVLFRGRAGGVGLH